MFKKSQQNTNRLVVEAKKVLFYNEATTWGGVSVIPKSSVDGFEPVLNSWGNFVIKGNIPVAMKVGQEYDIEISDLKKDAKYGDYYEFIRIYMEELNSVEAQQNFLITLLPEKQAKSIIEAFPNSMIVNDIANDVVDLTTIKGIGKTTAKRIKDKIDKNKDLGALLVELADLSLTNRMIMNIIVKFGSSSVALAKVRSSLYNLCSVSGISFQRVDKVALMRGEDKYGSKRIKAYSNHFFNEIANQGHSWANENIFIEQAVNDLDITGKHVRDYMRTDSGRKHFHWDEKLKRIASIQMYNNEKNTLKQLLRLSATYKKPANLDIDGAIKIAEDELGVKYTDEQKQAICESMDSGVFILNGKAGAGKTTVVKGIIEVLQQIGLTYKACALSGKASQVLLSKGIESGTIHRTFKLGTGNTSDSDDLEKNVLYDVLIVDESSMVNASLFSTILSRINDGSKVILVGDSGQLSGIGHGDILRDLLRTKYFKTVELKEVHRQAQDSGIIEMASAIRDGKQIIRPSFDGKLAFGNNKDMVLMGYQDKEQISIDVRRILIGYAKKIKSPYDLMDFQIAVAMKERGVLSAKIINKLAQATFNDLSKPYVSYNGYDFREGDKVIVKGNSYDIQYYDDIEHYNRCENKFGYDNEVEFENEEDSEINVTSLLEANYGDLFNGTMGIILKVFEKEEDGKVDKYVVIDFDGVGVVVYHQSELESVELAYAVTCHRLQGSTIKNVIVLLDYSAFTLLSKQWVYTAITRASQKCVLMVQSSALHKAISVDASGNRQTFLGDMINEVHKLRGSLEEVIKK